MIRSILLILSQKRFDSINSINFEMFFGSLSLIFSTLKIHVLKPYTLPAHLPIFGPSLSDVGQNLLVMSQRF